MTRNQARRLQWVRRWHRRAGLVVSSETARQIVLDQRGATERSMAVLRPALGL